MEKLGKLLLVLSVMITINACETTEIADANRAKVYYQNEEFILMNKRIETEVEGGNSYKTRVWVLHRVNSPADSVYVGKISSKVNDGNCTNNGSSNFKITNELWYSKEVGDILHFDFLRKDRFYKIPKDKVGENGLGYDDETLYITVESPVTLTIPEDNQETPTTNLEKERKILEIERQLISLQRELETLKGE